MGPATPRPLEGNSVLRRIAPFAAIAIAAFLTVPLPPADGNPLILAASGALTAVVVIACLLIPWARLPSGAQAVPPLFYFLVVALLRQAEGGAASGFAPLVLLPVLWFALHGSRVQLIVAIGGATATVLLPVLLLGAPDYPVSELRRAILLAGLASTVGLVVQRLVTEVRERSETQDAVARVIRALSAEGDSRQSICEAARQVAGASLAILMEPDTRGHLVSTAIDGMELEPIRIRTATEQSGAVTAFTEQKGFFAADPAHDEAISGRVVKATGAKAVLFEPVLRGSEAIGVLVAVWTRPIRGLPPRARAGIRLLAAEAAVAIERVDTHRQLQELARTDPLTGLANRRTWEDELDAAIARAARSGLPLTIALLDLDHFKTLNDKQGHSAGDRLLRAAAAAWNGELRDADLLVRYGGEEFAILLDDCERADARHIVDRVRHATPGGQTCSAGIATWDGTEGPDALVDRADGALYEAKRSGRNRTTESVAAASTG